MSMTKKLFAAAAAAALITAVTAASASAAPPPEQFSNDSTPGFTITGGTGPRFDTAVAGGASFPTVGAFNDVTMNGTPQLTSASIAPFTVIDDSGTGTGWSVTLLVPNFTDVGGDVVDASGAQMNAPVVASGTADSPMGGVFSNDVGDFTSAKKIVEADPTHAGAPFATDGVTKVAGMGTYLVSPQILKLVVPANATAGTYSTTATLAITNTP